MQRGFTLIAAVFLITVIAALGLFMVSLSATQHQTTMLAALGAQGYYAARAGAEWAVYRALNGSACAAAFAPGSLAGTMGDYTVTVTCSSTEHSTTSGDVTVWSVTSTAVRGSLGDRDHIGRTLTITFTCAPECSP